MASEKPDFGTLVNLASSDIGGLVLFATDEWFAPAQMFLQTHDPEFIPEKFTSFGKWMDGWETRRKRVPGHDWCLIKLGAPGTIYGFEVDTRFFTGNNVPAISILGAMLPNGPELPEDMMDAEKGVVGSTGTMGTHATPRQIDTVAAALANCDFFELLPRTPLRSGYPETSVHYFTVTAPRAATHLRVNYFPDGGVARLKVFGEVAPPAIIKNPRSFDFAAALNGGCALCWSNEHYGTPSNCLLPNRALRMDGGWETARNPHRPAILVQGADGYVDFSYSKDWFIMRLSMRADIDELEVDTNHFKGNFPESCLIEVCDLPDVLALSVLEQKKKFENEPFRDGVVVWKPLLRRAEMHPHKQHYFSRVPDKDALVSAGAATHVRVTIFPDGGVSRLRMYGTAAPSPAAKL